MRKILPQLQSLAARSLGVYDSSKPLNSLFPVASFVDKHCFVTKAGSFGIAFKVDGRGTDGMTPDQMQTASAAVRKGLRGLSDQFRLYQYSWKHSGSAIPAHIDEDHPAASTLKGRKDFLDARSQSAELFGFDQYWILLHEPAQIGQGTPLDRVRKALARHATLVIREARIRRNVEVLRSKASALVTELKSVVDARILDRKEAFFLLRVLGNLDAARAAYLELPERETYIDHLLCDVALYAGRDGLRLHDKHIEVMSLWKPPSRHRPNFFREVQKIKADYLLATEWRELDKLDADKLISNAQTHFATSAGLKGLLTTIISSLVEVLFGKQDVGNKEEPVKDEGKLDNVKELAELAKALNRGDGLGEYSATLVLYGPDREKLRESMNEASARLREFNALFAPESYNALNALLSIHPGNTHFNFRRQYLQRSMVADMALAYQEYQGELRNTHLGKEYLIACTTQDETPHYLNLWHEGVFGVLITGKTGSGKSTASNALLDHMQKYEPETLVLDVGGSYRYLCRKYDGTYMSLADLKVKCNPFSMDNTPRTRRSLSAFVKMLLENEGYKPDYKDTRVIFEAVGELMERPVDQRRLSKLDIGEALMEPLYRWIGKGEFGSVFDNVEDEITLSHFKVFDFQGIDDVPEIAEPLFFYLFMRHDRVVQDPARTETIKILWADEAWRFIENTTCRKQFIKAGKTYRKHNGAIALATQSAFDYKNAGIFEIISEVCPTKILLANPSADMKVYGELYHLNSAELEQFRTLIGKRQFLVKKEEQPAQVLNLLLSPYEVAQYCNSPFENARRDRYIEQLGWEKGLQAFAEELEGEMVNA